MTKMTREAASRIQANTCKKNDGFTPKNSFAARAMSSAYKNEPIASMNNNAQSNTSGQLLCKIGLFAVAVSAVGIVAVSSYYASQSFKLS